MKFASSFVIAGAGFNFQPSVLLQLCFVRLLVGNNAALITGQSA